MLFLLLLELLELFLHEVAIEPGILVVLVERESLLVRGDGLFPSSDRLLGIRFDGLFPDPVLGIAERIEGLVAQGGVLGAEGFGEGAGRRGEVAVAIRRGTQVQVESGIVVFFGKPSVLLGRGLVALVLVQSGGGLWRGGQGRAGDAEQKEDHESAYLGLASSLAEERLGEKKEQGHDEGPLVLIAGNAAQSRCEFLARNRCKRALDQLVDAFCSRPQRNVEAVGDLRDLLQGRFVEPGLYDSTLLILDERSVALFG